MDLVQVATSLTDLPLHAILGVAVFVLWRKAQALETKLEDCLSESANKSAENSPSSLTAAKKTTPPHN